jgi:NAD dependent epimerase/dehydratase family enzyme
VAEKGDNVNLRSSLLQIIHSDQEKLMFVLIRAYAASLHTAIHQPLYPPRILLESSAPQYYRRKKEGRHNEKSKQTSKQTTDKSNKQLLNVCTNITRKHLAINPILAAPI